MASPRKIYFHGGIHFVTLSMREGIMLPPNPLTKELLLKCLAQAQTLHPVNISHFLASSTHVHFLMRVIDPSDAADFVERFKTESSHALNRMLGRYRNNWCEGYDSPLIPDLATAIEKIAYIYSNPAKDYMADSVEYYPGFNTWRQFMEYGSRSVAVKQYETRYLARTAFEGLLPTKSKNPLREEDYRRIRRHLIHGKMKNHFEVDLMSWMERYNVTSKEEQLEVNQKILARTRELEAEYRAQREAAGHKVFSRREVVETPIGHPYTPDRTGKKMLVHCIDPKLRRKTIKWIKGLEALAKEVQERWKLGDYSVPYPEGLFPPNGMRLQEPIDW